MVAVVPPRRHGVGMENYEAVARPGGGRQDLDGMERRLEEFCAAEGHLYVPSSWECRDGFPLGEWVRSRRREYRQGSLHPRYLALGALSCWDWCDRHPRLVEGLSRLGAYVKQYETADVPYRYRCADGFKLGYWVKNRRQLVGKQPWLDEIVEAMPGWRSARDDAHKQEQDREEDGVSARPGQALSCRVGHGQSAGLVRL